MAKGIQKLDNAQETLSDLEIKLKKMWPELLESQKDLKIVIQNLKENQVKVDQK